MAINFKTVLISGLVLSLVFVQTLSSINFAVAEAGVTMISTPVKQIKLGISPSNVQCKANLELIFKITDGSPACVSIFTKDKLVQRGWGSSEGFGAILPAEPVAGGKVFRK